MRSIADWAFVNTPKQLGKALRELPIIGTLPKCHMCETVPAIFLKELGISPRSTRHRNSSGFASRGNDRAVALQYCFQALTGALLLKLALVGLFRLSVLLQRLFV